MIRSTRAIHFEQFFIFVLRVNAAKLLHSSEKNKLMGLLMITCAAISRPPDCTKALLLNGEADFVLFGDFPYHATRVSCSQNT